MEESTLQEFEIFKEAIREENLEKQIEITKRLGILAQHLGEEITRNELLPFIKENIDFHDEILLNLSEQLKEFVPLVGGYEHSKPILDVLMKLCNTDETIVRNKTVETLRNIAENLNGQLTESLLVPVVESLANEDWFTSKCSAAPLYPVIYQKVKEEKQTELRSSFRTLIEDDSPMVRKSAALSLVDLIPLLSKDCVKDEFVPVFDKVAKDHMDSVRVFAVDIAIALAKRLTEDETEEFVIKTVESWADDPSWRIRQKLAQSIGEVQKVLPYNKLRGKILALFQKLVKDTEPEVRIVAAKNLFTYCENFRKTYEGQKKLEENFEPVFQQSILPQIRLFMADPNEDVRLALSPNMLTLSSLMRQEFFKTHILPLIVDIFENEPSMAIQANMLQNLNRLPANIDLTESLPSIRNVIRSIIINSQTHWRTRRSLLVAFMHIARFANKEYFSENLKLYYAALLGDPVFSVRRTAALILPLIAKQYGMEWTLENIIPFFTMFIKDCRYLYRYVPLFGIKELISSSLNSKGTDEISSEYLKDLKVLVGSSKKEVAKKASGVLAKILKITEKIKTKLDEQTCKDVLSLNKSIDDFKSDNVSLYAEESMDVIKSCNNCNIFSIEEEIILQGKFTYLEGLLSLIYRDFLKVILELFDDRIVNVQIRSIHILNEIKEFLDRIEKELKEPWVADAITTLSAEEFESISNQVNLQLSQKVATIDEETVDTELMEDMNSAEKNTTTDIEMGVIEQKVPETKMESDDNKYKVSDMEMSVEKTEGVADNEVKMLNKDERKKVVLTQIDEGIKDEGKKEVKTEIEVPNKNETIELPSKVTDNEVVDQAYK